MFFLFFNLGKALLWACSDTSASELAPSFLKDRIAAARLLIDNNLQDGENPVEKVAVAVHSGAGGQVLMTELTPMVTDGDNSNGVENNNAVGGI